AVRTPLRRVRRGPVEGEAPHCSGIAADHPKLGPAVAGRFLPAPFGVGDAGPVGRDGHLEKVGLGEVVVDGDVVLALRFIAKAGGGKQREEKKTAPERTATVTHDAISGKTNSLPFPAEGRERGNLTPVVPAKRGCRFRTR